MEQILKTEIIQIINMLKRVGVPELIENENVPNNIVTSKHKFDLIDPKEGSPIKDFETGTAHYINGKEQDTYMLKIIFYDDFLHQFTYNDGNRHNSVNRLKDGVKSADFLIYEQSESKDYFIVHEISHKNAEQKIRVARKQLSDTLNQLYKSEAIKNFISEFKNKLCYLSAKDSRKVVNSEGMADGFNEIYNILPEPMSFNYGQIKTFKFSAYETSYVQLTK